jgi:hypothetical protein
MRVPGLVMTVQGGRRVINARRGRSSVRFTCTPGVILDDIHIGYTGELDLDAAVPLEHVAGIEVYAGGSAVPAQFSTTGTTCGMIVIWTR